MPTIDWSSSAFSGQLRRRRRFMELTQSSLAARSHCSLETVKKIEQGTRHPSRSMAVALAKALEIRGSERVEFVAAAIGERVPFRGGDSDSAGVVPGKAGPAAILGIDEMTIPTWNSFIGRDRDVAAVEALLSDHRIVTICGPGGVGKSRLAAELIQRSTGPRRAWAEFKDIESARGVDSVIARVLALRASASIRDAVAARLADDPWLIVLDDCEHRIREIGEFCTDTLRKCAQVRFLVASRVVTQVPGEARWSLNGLGVGGHEETHYSAAVDLFTDRALDVAPSADVGPDPDANGDIAQLCEMLDGLPLAIELAAARADLYSPPELLERIRDDATFLSVPDGEEEGRYRDLTEMVMWSYGLLSRDAQYFARCVAEFKGMFDVADAQAIIGPTVHGQQSETAIRELAVSSLIVRPLSGSRDFLMLPTIRSVMRQQLAPGESMSTRTRHASWFADLAESQEPALWTGAAPTALARLASRHSDLSAALAFACDSGDALTAARLCASLSRYWDLRGHIHEGADLMRRAAPLRRKPMPATIAAHAANGAGTIDVLAGDLRAAEVEFSRARVKAEAGRLEWDLAYALSYLGVCRLYEDDPGEARELQVAASVVATRSADHGLQGWAQLFQAVAEAREGNLGAVLELARRARAHFDVVGDDEGAGWSWIAEAAYAHLSGNEPGVELLISALERFATLEAAWGVSVAALVAGQIATARGEPRLACEFLILSDRLRSTAGATHLPVFEDWRGELLDICTASPRGRGVDAIAQSDDPTRAIASVVELVDHHLSGSGRDPDDSTT